MKVLELTAKEDVREGIKEMHKDEATINAHIFECLKYSVDNDFINAPISKITVEKTGKTFDMTYHRDKWENIFENLKDYFISTEEYEKCVVINEYIAKMYNA